ncbi:MAG: hotdog fold domain-containing protein [Pseudomonadota bacterium]
MTTSFDIDGSNCFACSSTNPIGLKICFSMEGELCVAEFTPGPNHVGYNDVVHGGILFTTMDDVMANWLCLQGRRAYTGKANIRYRREARVGETLRLEGACMRERRRLVELTARALIPATGEVVCEAEGTFMLTG